jgi:acyl-CoA synthetase (AMP-forming)/AMP-acid ligase II
MNILDAFIGNVSRHPLRTAIIDGRDAETTYVELSERAAALASAWTKAGLAEGDRVLIALRVDADLYASLAALWSIGAVAVLPEPALGRAGLREAVRATSPRALLTNGAYRLLPLISNSIRRIPLRLGITPDDRADPLRPVDLDEDHHALISFTSGSTGRPKAIARSHGFLHAQDAAVGPLLRTERSNVDLVGFPVFVVSALGRGDTSVLPCWSTGSPKDADPESIRSRCDDHSVHRLLLNPAVAERMTAAPAPRSLETLFVGGGPVFPDLVQRLVEWAPHLTIVPVYGSTESEPIAHHAMTRGSRPIDEADEGLMAGHVADGTRVRIVDDEIQVTGAHVVRGYLDPGHDATTKVEDAEGTIWHRTGDAGRIDAEGRLRLLGRVTSRVCNLWPFLVEARARTWPGVKRCALVKVQGDPMIAIEGDHRHQAEWNARFRAMGGECALHVRRMPVDARHGSKIDMRSLERLLS